MRVHVRDVLPFAVTQRVRLTCPHCGAEELRLAARVKKGMSTSCVRCRKRFLVEHVEAVIGTSAPTPRARR